MKTISDVQSEITQLYTALKESAIDLDFPTPAFDYGDGDVEFPPLTGELAEPIPKVSMDMLTTGQLNGTGDFDKLMQVMQKYLEREFLANRISATDYSKLLIEVMGMAIQQSAQFLLASNTTAWQARLLRAQAQEAEYTKVIAKLQAKQALLGLYKAEADMLTAQLGAYTAQGQLINTKMALSTAFEQINVLEENIDSTRAQTKETLKDGSPVTGILGAQKENVFAEIEQIQEQILNLTKQREVYQEQIEAQRAQTTNTRTDNTPVTGILGAQRELYLEQKSAYSTDAKAKVAKMGLDTWATRKGVGDAIEPPVNFDVDAGGLGRGNLDAIVKALLNHVDLPNA